MQAIRISNMEKLNSNLFSCCNFCCFFCSKQSFLFSRINHFNLRKWRYTRTISITVVVGFLRFQLYIDRLVGRMINDHLCRLQSQANLSAWLSVCPSSRLFDHLPIHQIFLILTLLPPKITTYDFWRMYTQRNNCNEFCTLRDWNRHTLRKERSDIFYFCLKSFINRILMYSPFRDRSIPGSIFFWGKYVLPNNKPIWLCLFVRMFCWTSL